MESSLEDKVQSLDSSDGFYVNHFLMPGPGPEEETLHAYVGFRLNGKESDLPGVAENGTSHPIKQWKNPTDHDFGDCDRICLLVEAVCRYINTGGKFQEMVTTLAMLSTSVKDIDFDFGNLKLASTALEEGKYMHLFTSLTDNKAVTWWEDNYIEATVVEGDTLEYKRR